ncbi:MAG TPA: hypothetical protein VKJ01_13040, partial [Candidatus Solibacter sp.]|nr:hypothetical protein [Candidatus Solibacter sp.]
MIVVADATPLRYLVLIDETDILPALYDRILIPPAVLRELTRQRTPPKVQEWIAGLPGWRQVRAPLSASAEFPATLSTWSSSG